MFPLQALREKSISLLFPTSRGFQYRYTSEIMQVPLKWNKESHINFFGFPVHIEIIYTILQTAAAAAKSLQSCLTVQPHRRQPTRLHRPWDSAGKNTGVGCHFLLQCMKVKSKSEVTQLCLTPSDPTDYSPPGPPSMGFSRQEYWSGVPLPSPVLQTTGVLQHHVLKINCTYLS